MKINQGYVHALFTRSWRTKLIFNLCERFYQPPMRRALLQQISAELPRIHAATPLLYKNWDGYGYRLKNLTLILAFKYLERLGWCLLRVGDKIVNVGNMIVPDTWTTKVFLLLSIVSCVKKRKQKQQNIHGLSNDSVKIFLASVLHSAKVDHNE